MLYFGTFRKLCQYLVFKSFIINSLSDSLFIQQLESHFKPGSAFSNADLMKFYVGIDGEITKSTLNWRIHSLLRRRYIKRQGRGLYALGEPNEFIPDIDRSIKKIDTQIQNQFPYAKICIWNTKNINQWMLHQPSRFFTMVEVEKDAVESVFHFLQEHYANVFFQPSADILQRYALNKPNVIIVVPLISEAPTQQVQQVNTITLEKLIVDIFSEPELFPAQQGSELSFIYNNIFSKYTINKNRLIRYADRRKQKEAILKYLNSNTNFRHFYK